MATRIRHHEYNARREYDRGRPLWFEALWYGVKCVFFLSPVPWPAVVRRVFARAFGAKIGRNVYIKPRVNIHFPWRLTIGDHSLIGEEVFILNFETVTIGQQCCLSQRAFLCAGNHDYKDPLFPYRNAPIVLGDGVWIGAQSFVGPGVRVADEAVVCAGSVVTTDLAKAMVCAGNPCTPKKLRWPEKKTGILYDMNERVDGDRPETASLNPTRN
jgi:putative colanic acid biosynthesis acetyltransferase WcaF